MYKEIIRQIYCCDLCGKEITGSVFSPIWGELEPGGDGNFRRDGDIMNTDICADCKEKAEGMISGLFHAEEIDAKKRKPTGRKIALDEGKVLALRRAGWSMAKIAEEFGVSTATINRCLKKLEAAAFVEEFPEVGEMEGENEDYD